MKLSSNFNLSEFTRSEKAKELGINNDLDWIDSAWIIDNLERLCKYTLEPIRRSVASPVHVTSGYRCSRLNEVVGGSPTSDHRYGLAADIYFDDFANRWYEVVIYLITNTHVPFDQLIIYKNFLHIGIGRAMRRQVLDYRNR